MALENVITVEVSTRKFSWVTFEFHPEHIATTARNGKRYDVLATTVAPYLSRIPVPRQGESIAPYTRPSQNPVRLYPADSIHFVGMERSASDVGDTVYANLEASDQLKSSAAEKYFLGGVALLGSVGLVGTGYVDLLALLVAGGGIWGLYRARKDFQEAKLRSAQSIAGITAGLQLAGVLPPDAYRIRGAV